VNSSFIQTFSPSEFFIAFENARQDRGNARSSALGMLSSLEVKVLRPT
jgi:hypothetical protein